MDINAMFSDYLKQESSVGGSGVKKSTPLENKDTPLVEDIETMKQDILVSLVELVNPLTIIGKSCRLIAMLTGDGSFHADARRSALALMMIEKYKALDNRIDHALELYMREPEGAEKKRYWQEYTEICVQSAELQTRLENMGYQWTQSGWRVARDNQTA